MALSQYAMWFRSALACAECGECSFVCNGNIDPAGATAAGETLPVGPQPGFVEPEWFAADECFRVLILGMNPAGGAEMKTALDRDLYGRVYPAIRNATDPAAVLSRHLATLKQYVSTYRPTRTFLEDVRSGVHETRTKHAVMAYCNQVLCRTIPEAAALGKAVRPAYCTCFAHNLLPLIQLLSPDLTVVMGWNLGGSGWAQRYFGPLLQKAREDGNHCPPMVWVGVQQTTMGNNRVRAGSRVRELLSTGTTPMAPRDSHLTGTTPVSLASSPIRRPDTQRNSDPTCRVVEEPSTKALSQLFVYAGETLIGEYERAKPNQIARKKEEVAAAFGLLLDIFRKYRRPFEVRWVREEGGKVVRIDGKTVAVIPRQYWRG